MPIAPVLQAFVDDELARAPALIERTLVGTRQLLRDPSDSPLPASERGHQGAAAAALTSHAEAFQHAFVDALREGVDEALRARVPDAGGAARAAPELELMDESRVEIDIEISRAMQLIDTTAEWELRELQTFTSTLVGQTHVSADSNPFGPQVYASALWQAVCAASPVPADRIVLLRVAAGVAAGLLKNAWAAASSRLEAQGIAPGVYRSVVLPIGSVSGRGPAAPDIASANTLANLIASMPGGSDTVRVSVGNAAVPMGTASPGPTMMQAGFEPALAELEALLREPLPAADASPDALAAIQARAQRLNQHRLALLASTGTAAERQAIEFVSRVFDHVAIDPQLPAPYAPVIARLRGSVLRVALNDPELLSSTRHAVWQFLDGLGAAAAGNPATRPVIELCQRLVEQLASVRLPDAALYRRALAQLEALLANRWEERLGAAQGTVLNLQQAERRALLEQRLAQRLVDQLAPARTTPGVRRFMTGPWARVLAEAILRDGEQGETTRGYIKFVDELLWSVQLPDHPKSRQRLIALLPDLLARLRAGMASIKLPPNEQQAVLDELMGIHADALRPSGRGAELSAQQLVQRMRDEVLPAQTGHGGFSDSVIDLGSMDTVPAEMLNTTAEAPIGDPAKRIDMLRPGDRARLFLLGRWSRVQLLWRSDMSLYFLLAGEFGARNHSITRRALERLAGAGLLQPLEARTLVRRTLDAITRDVNRLGSG